MKHRGMEYWERHGEKGAHIFVEAGEDANPDQRKSVGQQMADAGQDAVTVAPLGYKANLLESKATGDLYDRMIAAANAAFAVLLSGHANNAEVKDANTGATAGETIRYNLLQGLAEAWASFAHDQVLEPYAEVNFGDRDLAQWPSYPIPKPDELQKRGAGLKALGEGASALKAADEAVDVPKIFDSAGIPRLTPAELAAQKAAAPAPAPAPTPPAPAPPSPTTPSSATGADASPP